MVGERAAVGRTVSVRWRMEVPSAALSWVEPATNPATVKLADRELAGIVTLTGAATIAGSALVIRIEVSVVAVLEIVTVMVEVVATLKEGVNVVSAESEIAGGGGGGGSGGGGGGGGVAENAITPV